MLDNIVKHLIITVSMVCMCLFTVFGQYYLFLVFPKNSGNNDFELGISYYYLYREVYSDLLEMNGTFKVLRVPLEMDVYNFNSYVNNQTDLFFRLAKQYFKFEVAVIVWHSKLYMLDDYLNRWGRYVDYVQILNEPDIAKAWQDLNGSLFMDEEIYTIAYEIASVVKAYNDVHKTSIKLYTNLTPAILVRSSLTKIFENLTDFIGLDIYYTQGIIQLTPFIYQCLTKLMKNKEIIITEFGACELDDDLQSRKLIEGLTFFKNFGFKKVWIFLWNTGDDPVVKGYGICGRPSFYAIRDWYAGNR